VAYDSGSPVLLLLMNPLTVAAGSTAVRQNNIIIMITIFLRGAVSIIYSFSKIRAIKINSSISWQVINPLISD
jgi:hypothetical protein